MHIKQLKIRKLHGHRDITIKIRDNRIVLVGVNGIGKTTVVNLLYFFLTMQWRRLQQMDFKDISLEIDKTKITISREEIVEYNVSRRGSIHSTHYSKRFESLFEDRDFLRILRKKDIDQNEIKKFAYSRNIPPAVLQKYIIDIFKLGNINLNFFEESGPLIEAEDLLRNTVRGHVFYLPTYRRIEQDLQSIFYGERRGEETLEKLSRRIAEKQSRKDSGYIELVQFGMEDIDNLIKSVLSVIKEKARTDLNNLAGSYLGDVIRGEAQTYDEKIISSIDDNIIDSILGRVEEHTLSEGDKSKLRAFIKRLREGSGILIDQDKYLAHFLSKLIDLHERQKEEQAQIGSLVNACNKYLDGKKFIYDDITYDLSIVNTKGIPIDMGMLSSGEKQIVSLFSHIYLGEDTPFIIIIDEPELSLSVEWQRMFLPDIWSSGKCSFLVAVTHSPFIFDNEMEDYTIDLGDCIKE